MGTTTIRFLRQRTSTQTSEYLDLTVLLDTLHPVHEDENLFSLVSEQLTGQKGIERFGEAGATTIGKELEPLLTRRVMRGVHADQLTSAQQRTALTRYLMFVKESSGGTIKGRGCADGGKQRAALQDQIGNQLTDSQQGSPLSLVSY
jgi:hypothetical protein